MSEKFLIFGATGSIGSSLAEQLKNSGNDIHLIARNESEVSSIAEKLGCSFTVADVLEEGFIEKVKADISEIKGIAYCIGSIDLKPLRMVTRNAFLGRHDTRPTRARHAHNAALRQNSARTDISRQHDRHKPTPRGAGHPGPSQRHRHHDRLQI